MKYVIFSSIKNFISTAFDHGGNFYNSPPNGAGIPAEDQNHAEPLKRLILHVWHENSERVGKSGPAYSWTRKQKYFS
jgi:hypothetical protein